MSGKRRATSDLNHDNWEQEDEPEDAGTFKRASQDELNRRIIKTAKRRKPVVCEEDSNKKSAFANLTALSKVSAPSATAFSFLSKLSGDVTNEETKEKEETKEEKKLHENERKEVDQFKNKINDDKLLKTSNIEMSGEMGDKVTKTDNNSGETEEMDSRRTKDIIENSSLRMNASTNCEISGDADKRVENSNNKTELEEFSSKTNIDSDTVVSQDCIVSNDKKSDEALNDNSEKNDTNNP